MRFRLPFLTLVLTVALAACQPGGGRTHYYQFRSVADARWAQGDTLRFVVDTVRQAESYALSVELRTTAQADVRQVWIQVDQRLTGTDSVLTDTLCFQLYDTLATKQGEGFYYHELAQPCRSLRLQTGQGDTVRIWHLMDTTSLSGLAGVGVKLEAMP